VEESLNVVLVAESWPASRRGPVLVEFEEVVVVGGNLWREWFAAVAAVKMHSWVSRREAVCWTGWGLRFAFCCGKLALGEGVEARGRRERWAWESADRLWCKMIHGMPCCELDPVCLSEV